MNRKILFTTIALGVLVVGIANAGGTSPINAIGNAITALSADDIESSGLSAASFGNVLTPYDAIRQPWQYPDVVANRSRRLGFNPDGTGVSNGLIWTRLGNTSREDTYGGAYLGNTCEKGLLGAQLSFSTDEHDDLDINQFPGSTQTTTDNEKLNQLSGYVGYGWAPTDKVSHGVGLTFFSGEDSSRTRFLDDSSGGNASRFEIERSDITLTYGVKFKPRDEFSWTLEGHYGTGSLDTFSRFSSLDAMGDVTVATTFGRADLGTDTFGLAGRFNWYPNDTWDYELRWGLSRMDYSFDNTLFDYQDNGGTINSFANITGDSIDASRIDFTGRVGWHEGPLHIYGGVAVNQWTLDADVVGDFDNPMSFQFEEGGETEILSISPSVAFVYEFNKHVALVGGAQYSWIDESDETSFGNIDVMTPGNSSFFFDEIEWTTNDSAIRAALELRYKKLIVDIGVAHSENDGMESLNTEDIFFSARFGF